MWGLVQHDASSTWTYVEQFKALPKKVTNWWTVNETIGHERGIWFWHRYDNTGLAVNVMPMLQQIHWWNLVRNLRGRRHTDSLRILKVIQLSEPRCMCLKLLACFLYLYDCIPHLLPMLKGIISIKASQQGLSCHLHLQYLGFLADKNKTALHMTWIWWMDRLLTHSPF